MRDSVFGSQGPAPNAAEMNGISFHLPCSEERNAKWGNSTPR